MATIPFFSTSSTSSSASNTWASPSDVTGKKPVASAAIYDEYGETDYLLQPETSKVSQTPVVPQSAIDNMMDATDLVQKTVFLKTRFGALGNTRKVTGSEVLETDADMSLLKVSKTLLESPELEAIKKADGKMRAWLYNTCLPYDMGIQLLPVGMIEAAQDKMSAFKVERAALVENLILAYPKLVEGAAKNLGSLYDAADYPSVEQIRAKFIFEWQYVSFGVPGHLKSISATLFAAEQEKAAKQMEAATEEITALMRETMYKLVAHLQDKLSPKDDGKAKILRESAVTNLTEFLNSFDMRNVTNDQELAQVVAKARQLLGGTTATSIRSSDSLKANILSGVDSIMDSLNTMVTDKPGRKFRDDEDDTPVPDGKMLAANDL